MNDPTSVPVKVYKDLICEMIQSMDDTRFIRKIYSLIYLQIKRNQQNTTPKM